MKIGTQNQAFFPENILEKFLYIKEMGFDGFEIDGKLLVNNLAEVKAAIKETGLPVTTACGGYDGWIGDFIEERRLNGLKQIERILEALAEVGGPGNHCACRMGHVYLPSAANDLAAEPGRRSQNGQ
ncbi:Sugar phosphate isomerases/epimerases familyprotein YcjR [Salmonella enterica subsp. arizonae]|uniref:Sugar phosphate isomerases/epimerases familyprotein YcjR n=1 Tax=Salmonella enterica subsp. arizonae TaxID=59203 RepID=A0A379SU93_SALER|nr:Sugar phosphate isomerases/epimerases familyprotein YcjR [Salmonella enterica subsp. arizonae]